MVCRGGSQHSRAEYVKRYEYSFVKAECFSEAIWQYNKAIVDATYDLIPAVKPQIAMYESEWDFDYKG